MPIPGLLAVACVIPNVCGIQLHPRVIALWNTVIHHRFRLLPHCRCLCSLRPNVRLGSRTERRACVPITITSTSTSTSTSTNFALVLVLSFSGARTRNRRSCAAETSPLPARLRRSTLRVDSVPLRRSTLRVDSVPLRRSTLRVDSVPLRRSTLRVDFVPLRRSTLRVDSVWHVHDSDSRATTGKRPLCVLQGRLLSSVSSASSCSSLPTRYRPMEYGDSSPFSCSARRLASCTTSTWERNGRSLCSPSSPRKAFGVREPNGSARIRQRRL